MSSVNALAAVYAPSQHAGRMNQRSPREVFQAAMAAPPMSPTDQLERRELISREYARAEARREPTPQLELGEAA